MLARASVEAQSLGLYRLRVPDTDAIDKANGDAKKSARGIYNRLYRPLSNFTVHASGGTLMRHVRRKGRLRRRPS
jgi:hypothetical protein